MTKENLDQGIKLLNQVKQMEDIIRRVENGRIKEIVLADGTTVNYLPRGDIKDAIIKNCREKIAECNLRIEQL